MNKLEQLSQEIYILNALHLILDKFEMNDEAENITAKIKEKRKTIDESFEYDKFFIKRKRIEFYELDKIDVYLSYSNDFPDWKLSDDIHEYSYQTQFTYAEIEDIKIKFDTNLSEFDIIPVEEELERIKNERK